MFSSMQTLLIVILMTHYIFSVTMFKLYKDKPTKDKSEVTFPWVGVLRVRPNGQNKEAVTGIVMIVRHWAMGNANEISKISKDYLRNITQAMFFRPNGVPFQCGVAKYIIHPEFEIGILNTIALIKLKYKLDQFPWRVIKWPLTSVSAPTDVYAIGFTDRNKVLQQVKYKMVSVNQTDCKEFYRREEIDFKSMWPVGFSCYTRKYSQTTCVFDAGMALATNSTGMWTLLGISTLGPGCALPARFIDFYRYVPWIETKVIIPRWKDARRQAYGMYRIWQNADQDLMSKLYTNEITMRPYRYGTTTEYGRCTGELGNLVYRDRVMMEVDDLDTNGYGVAFFALTLYDLFYNDFTCITLKSYCEQRSRSTFYFSHGFKQEDVDAFTKRVPFKMFRDSLLLPRIHTLHSRWMDFDDLETAWFYVKCQFRHFGYMDVKIYGNRIVTTTTTTTTPKSSVSTPSTRRPTRSYWDRWRPSPPTTTKPLTQPGTPERPGIAPRPSPGRK